MIRKHSLALFPIALILISALTGCGAPAATPSSPVPPSAERPAAPQPTVVPKLEKVKIMITSPSAVLMDIFLGKEKGIFREEGVDIEPIAMKSTLAVPALLSGEIDYAALFRQPYVGGLKGLPTRLLMVTVLTPMWHLMAPASVNSVADLKGKAIRVSQIGGSDHYTTMVTVKALGLNPDKDLTYISIPDHATGLAALKSGSVAAATLQAPFHAMAAEAGFKELAFTGDYLKELPTAGMSTTTAKIKENPGQVKRMVRARLKTMAYMRDKPEDTVDFMIQFLNVDRKSAKVSYDDLVRTLSFTGAVTEKGMQAAVDAERASGALTGEVDLKKGYDFGALQEAQKELKLLP